jgi:hypothetical protein
MVATETEEGTGNDLGEWVFEGCLKHGISGGILWMGYIPGGHSCDGCNWRKWVMRWWGMVLRMMDGLMGGGGRDCCGKKDIMQFFSAVFMIWSVDLHGDKER